MIDGEWVRVTREKKETIELGDRERTGGKEEEEKVVDGK